MKKDFGLYIIIAVASFSALVGLVNANCGGKDAGPVKLTCRRVKTSGMPRLLPVRHCRASNGDRCWIVGGTVSCIGD